jgi:hypothetical protein
VTQEFLVEFDVHVPDATPESEVHERDRAETQEPSRRAGTGAMSSLPIADYALLSDLPLRALVSLGGSIDWLCFPRFDSPSVFGRILDDGAGHWSIRPAGRAEGVTRRYLDDTLLLETTFITPTSSVTLTDALAVARHERGHALGAGGVGAVLRRVVGVSGTVDIEMEYTPRPEYGLVAPALYPEPDGLTARGGAHVLRLSSPVPLEIDGFTARARATVRAGEARSFALHCRTTSDSPPRHWTQTEIRDRLDDTAEAWRTWSSLHQSYDGPWAELVGLSGRVLYGLTYFPTGAIVAAPTTSLPEVAGGEQNWDTGTRGSVTRRSRSAPSGSQHVPTRPTSSSTTWPTRRCRRSDRAPTSRSCSASGANTTSPNGPLGTCRVGRAVRRCGSATGRPTSASSTCTASCSTPPTACPSSSAGWVRSHGRSWPTWLTSPLSAGRRRTTASGRFGASHGTSSTAS